MDPSILPSNITLREIVKGETSNVQIIFLKSSTLKSLLCVLPVEIKNNVWDVCTWDSWFKRNIESGLIFLRHTSGITRLWVISGSMCKYRCTYINVFAGYISREVNKNVKNRKGEKEEDGVWIQREATEGEIYFSTSPVMFRWEQLAT